MAGHVGLRAVEVSKYVANVFFAYRKQVELKHKT
jgi:hypothetical protein